MPFIPYARQSIEQSDIDAAVDVLQSDFLTQGPVVPRFESAVADYCGAAHAVAVNSATSALHLACLALGLGEGDLLWTSPITFVASANCALYCGAEVDFVDIDAESFNLSVATLQNKLETASRENRLPKVLVVVHMAGLPAEMEQIAALARQYQVRIIEDASHALGAFYRERPVGCGDYSDITVFSFHPVKQITTAEGGMAVTNHSQLAEQMRMLRSHGVTRDPALMSESAEPWVYEQQALGFNYRLSDLQAALGISQLSRLDEFVEKRSQLASRYQDRLVDLPLDIPTEPAHLNSAWHLYIVRLQTDRAALDRRSLFRELRKRDIGVNVHYIPVHTQPFYRALGFNAGDFPVAEAYYERALTLPLFPGLTDDQQQQVVAELYEILG